MVLNPCFHGLGVHGPAQQGPGTAHELGSLQVHPPAIQGDRPAQAPGEPGDRGHVGQHVAADGLGAAGVQPGRRGLDPHPAGQPVAGVAPHAQEQGNPHQEAQHDLALAGLPAGLFQEGLRLLALVGRGLGDLGDHRLQPAGRFVIVLPGQVDPGPKEGELDVPRLELLGLAQVVVGLPGIPQLQGDPRPVEERHGVHGALLGQRAPGPAGLLPPRAGGQGFGQPLQVGHVPGALAQGRLPGGDGSVRVADGHVEAGLDGAGLVPARVGLHGPLQGHVRLQDLPLLEERVGQGHLPLGLGPVRHGGAGRQPGQHQAEQEGQGGHPG